MSSPTNTSDFICLLAVGVGEGGMAWERLRLVWDVELWHGRGCSEFERASDGMREAAGGLAD